MKKILLSTTIVLMTAAVLRAIWVYNSALVNEPALAYNKNYTLNLSQVPNSTGISHLTAQAVYSSATLSAGTFTDGRVSTASLTVNTIVGLSTAAATDRITIAADSVVLSSAAWNTITVSSGIAGSYILLNGTKLIYGGRVDTTAHVAADLASQINTYVYPVIANSHSTSIISLSARTAGQNGNAFTLVSSTPAALTAGFANFIGGHDSAFENASLTVNGRVYKHGYYWNLPGSVENSTGTAVSIASLLNTISGIQAHAAGSVVFATATVAGSASNAFTIVSSTPNAMTVLSGTFTGGVDNACIAINGTSLCSNRDFYVGASTAATAHAISDAIMANTTLNAIVASTWSSHAVIYTTSTHVGTATNYALTSSAPSAIVVSFPTYIGGQNAAFAVGSPNILIPSNGFTTAIPVLFSTGGATPPSPLVNQTTYYVIPVDANNIELATTSARAQTGQYVTFASSSITGPHTFTLTPLAYTGTAYMQWFASNDGVNYNPVDISSVTYSSPSYIPTSTLWDFGSVNYKYFQLDVTAPTAGGLNLVVTVHGSN